MKTTNTTCNSVCCSGEETFIGLEAQENTLEWTFEDTLEWSTALWFFPLNVLQLIFWGTTNQKVLTGCFVLAFFLLSYIRLVLHLIPFSAFGTYPKSKAHSPYGEVEYGDFPSLPSRPFALKKFEWSFEWSL